MSTYTDASLIMFPSGYKEDKIYSLKPTDGSGDLTFTRASTGTRINSSGLVEVCPWNLVEYSEDFSNGYWSKLNATITANNTTAPNGTNTADLITSTGTTETGVFIIPSVIGTNTWSIYAKKGTGRYLFFNTNTPLIAAKFDLQDGIIVGTPSTGATPSIESVGNGWYRCIITSSTSTNRFTAFITNNTTTSDLTSSVGLSCYLWGAQLNIGSTAKPYFPTTDRLNVPRLTYQNGGGGCPSLLLEKQSTNLFTYSEQFDNAGWTKLGSSITANSTTSPDGTQNADSIIDNTTNSRHVMEQAITGDLSISRAMSLYAKQNTLRYLYMSVTNAGDSHCYSAIFDLQNGTVSATKVNGSATINASIESVGNGWYRCAITGTMTSGTATFYPLIGTSDRGGFTGTLVNNNAPSYAGSGQSLFIYGAQLEASSYQTSYIPTTSSSATRVADACSKTGISSLIGQTQGTLFGEFTFTGISPLMHLFCSVAGSFANAIYIQSYSSSGISMQVWSGVINQVAIDSSGLTIGQNVKFAAAYNANDFAFYVNGIQVGTDTSGSVPAGLSQLEVGGYAESGSPFIYNNSMKQAIVFPTRLTNTQLAELTTI